MNIDWITLFTGLGEALAYLGLFAIMLLIAKWLKDLWTPYSIPHELTKADNPAIGLEMSGYFLATTLTFVGAVTGDSTNFLQDLSLVAGYSFLGILMLNASRVVMDKLLFNKFCSVKKVIEGRNIGVASVRFGLYLATGAVAGGSIHGQGGGFDTAIAFFVLGQIVLILFSKIYELLTPYNTHEEIDSENTAAGIALAGTFIALGIIIAGAAHASFISWTYNLVLFAELAISGMVLLVIVRFFMDKLILVGDDLNREISEDRNLAAGFLEATVAIAFAIVLAILL
ncbi:DUF350 domain-containing protein [Kiloniella sp. EL199]|uniref:DUF350 domain-containing protein n=1 Tax=Kiloniella sp. EL199 TaxID=2107581 RepID=UPI000EA01CE9|nr:DUF350 domain-containing protein [Kiloniella sp. EL199]